MNRNEKELSWTDQKKNVRSKFTAAAFNKPRLEVGVWSRVNIQILLYFIIINATLSKSLSFTASFLIVWNRVYAGCIPYAHTICINNGKNNRQIKIWRRTWQIYRFGSAHLQLLYHDLPFGSWKRNIFWHSQKKVVTHSVSSPWAYISHFRIIIRWLLMITDSKLVNRLCVLHCRPTHGIFFFSSHSTKFVKSIRMGRTQTVNSRQESQ